MKEITQQGYFLTVDVFLHGVMEGRMEIESCVGLTLKAKRGER